MDFEPLLRSRLQIRRRHEMPLHSTEFVFHAGSPFLVDWADHPFDEGGVRLNAQRLIGVRFNGVAMRLNAVIERYYAELALRAPSDRFHWVNVRHALLLSSGCLGAIAQALDGCTARADIIQEIFLEVRNAVGTVATSADALTSIAAEDAMESVIRAMNDRLRRAGCLPHRIVA